MFKEISNTDRFTRTVFGIVLMGTFFFPWGRYAALILGILFLISAAFGICVTCWFYERFIVCRECKVK